MDYCLTSLDEARQLTGMHEADDIADYYLQLGAKNVVLKMGEAGAMFANAGQRFTCAGHRVNTVDATGAGDCFTGAFLTRIIQVDTPEAALFYANCAAALTTTGYGAVAPIPKREEVEACIRRQR